MPKLRTIALRLTDGLGGALDRAAARSGESGSEIARRALMNYLNCDSQGRPVAKPSRGFSGAMFSERDR